MEKEEFEKNIEKELKALWKRTESNMPDKNNANDPEYYKVPTMRVIFSDNRKILDIEDIAENNIRIIDNEEAVWLRDILNRFIEYS